MHFILIQFWILKCLQEMLNIQNSFQNYITINVEPFHRICLLSNKTLQIFPTVSDSFSIFTQNCLLFQNAQLFRLEIIFVHAWA